MSKQRIKILISAKDNASKAVRGISKGLKKLGKTAKKMAKGVVSSFGRIGKSLLSFKSALIGAAGIAGIGYLMKQSMNATDEMAKMSRAIGVGVEDLQRFRHAGAMAGLESTAMDKAIQKLAVNMADVAKGTGEAKDIFEKYGISAVNSQGKLRSVKDVMAEVADVTRGLTNKTEKAELAYRLFGARGGKMINMLNNGSAAMRAQMADADRLGIVLSEKTVIGVEKANDALHRMNAAMGSVFDKLTASLAPALEGFGNFWAEWWGAFSTSIQPSFDWINLNLGKMSTNLDSAKDSGASWGETVNKWVISMTETLRHYFKTMDEDGTTASERFQASISAAIETAKEFGKTFMKWFEKIKGFLEKHGESMWSSIKNGAFAVSAAMNDIGGTIDRLIHKFNRLKIIAMAALAGAAAGSLAGPVGTVIGGIVGGMAGSAATETYQTPNGSRASGGGVSANQSYLVGERGAETFTPTTSGRVSPNTGGSSNVTNIYTNATAHGINNALSSRGDNVSRGARVGMNIARATGLGGFGNLSMARSR